MICTFLLRLRGCTRWFWSGCCRLRFLDSRLRSTDLCFWFFWFCFWSWLGDGRLRLLARSFGLTDFCFSLFWFRLQFLSFWFWLGLRGLFGDLK